MTTDKLQDGVHAMVPREKICESVQKLRDTYDITAGIPLFKREFGFYCQNNGGGFGRGVGRNRGCHRTCLCMNSSIMTLWETTLPG